MKSFRQYLTESTKVYSFKIKVAGELPDQFQENLKASLDRCGVVKLDKLTTTPIQALPLDFPNKKNCEVTVFEFKHKILDHLCVAEHVGSNRLL